MDDDELICAGCSGSGEGRYDGTNCRTCGGSGVVPSAEEAERQQTEREYHQERMYQELRDRRFEDDDY